MALGSVDAFISESCGRIFREDELRRTSLRRSLSKAALTVSVSAMALALAGGALAQETQLPGIDVQGAQAKKASAPKAKSKPKPVEASETQAAPPAAAREGGDQAEMLDAPYNTPAAVSAAGQGDIQRFGQSNLQNVLRSMPGVSTGNDPNNPGIAVNIRGFEGSGQVNMTIDGVRQNFGFTGHTAS